MYVILLILLFFYINSNKVVEQEYINRGIPVAAFGFNKGTYAGVNYLNTYYNISRMPYSFYGEESINQEKVIDSQVKIPEYYMCVHYKDDVNVNTYDISVTLHFYLTKFYARFQTYLGLGLAFKFNNEQYSYVHQLYNEKLINYRAFAFIPDKDIEKGKIVYGKENNDNYPYSGYCNVEDSHFTWGCNLTRIIYDNKEYSINLYAMFVSISPVFFESKIIVNFMKDILLKDKFEDSTCVLLSNSFLNNRIQCKAMFMEDINKNITFVFGDLKISFNINLLFNRMTDNLYSIFYYKDEPTHKIDTDNNIIIGFPFITLFNTTIFDYEQKRIIFYSDTITTEVHSSNPYIKLIIITNIIQLFLSIIINIGNKLYK